MFGVCFFQFVRIPKFCTDASIRKFWTRFLDPIQFRFSSDSDSVKAGNPRRTADPECRVTGGRLSGCSLLTWIPARAPRGEVHPPTPERRRPGQLHPLAASQRCAAPRAAAENELERREGTEAPCAPRALQDARCVTEREGGGGGVPVTGAADE